MPGAVISAFPSLVTLPPDTALVKVIPDTTEVVSTRGAGFFSQDCINAEVAIERKTMTVIFRLSFMFVLFRGLKQKELTFIETIRITFCLIQLQTTKAD